MLYKYLLIDSRGAPVAHAISEDGPEKAVWQLQIDDGDLKRVLEHEFVSLVSTSEKVPAMEGRIVRRRDNVIAVESVRTLGEEVRKNLRMPGRFESFLYPVTGRWKGRAPILSNDLSCGGLSFFCARPLEVRERVQVVIPVTAQPLLLEMAILRQRPSGEQIPLYAGAFEDLLHEEETMVREAVFGLQLQYHPEPPRQDTP